MTIIETTVILSVMFILAGAMSPIVSESITTARAVKAKNDASMIATGLLNFEKDLGGDALALGGSAAPVAAPLSLPDVLATAGASPAAGETDDTSSDSSGLMALLSRSGGDTDTALRAERAALRPLRRRWRQAPTGALDDHLRTNRRGYRFRRPGEYGGWNGPYVSAEVKGDPWGNAYMVNTRFLDGGGSVADAAGTPRRAVFVLSAGADGVIDTPFEQSMVDAKAYGDDIVIRIQ